MRCRWKPTSQEPPSHHTGGVYGSLTPSPELPHKSGEWQSFDITLVGGRLTVVQNGQTVIDEQEMPGITGGALESHQELSGPIYLQGSVEGRWLTGTLLLRPRRNDSRTICIGLFLRSRDCIRASVLACDIPLWVGGFAEWPCVRL